MEYLGTIRKTGRRSYENQALLYCFCSFACKHNNINMKALGEKGRSILSSTSIKPRKLPQGVNQLPRDSFHLIYRKIPLIYYNSKVSIV